MLYLYIIIRFFFAVPLGVTTFQEFSPPPTRILSAPRHRVLTTCRFTTPNFYHLLFRPPINGLFFFFSSSFFGRPLLLDLFPVDLSPSTAAFSFAGSGLFVTCPNGVAIPRPCTDAKVCYLEDFVFFPPYVKHIFFSLHTV